MDLPKILLSVLHLNLLSKCLISLICLMLGSKVAAESYFIPIQSSNHSATPHLKLGVAAPDYPPFDFVVQGKTYEGIGADYALLIKNKLNIPVFAVRFNNRDDAIGALQQGNIDLLANSNAFETSHDNIVLSTPYLEDQAAITTRIDFDWPQQRGYTDLTVVAAYDYLPLSVLQSRFPGATIRQEDSPAKAMATLVYGQADLMFSELQVAGYLIEHNYPNAVKIAAIDPPREQGLGFALNTGNTRLLTKINEAIQHFTPAEHALIARRWGVAGLGAKAGVQTNEQSQLIRVVVDRSSPPLSYFDEQGTYRGITADLLARISLTTGLRFVFIPVNSIENALTAVKNGEADMLVDFNPDNTREQYIGFSRPYLIKPFVWVSAVSSGKSPPNPDQPVSIALPQAHTLFTQIQSKYPFAKLIETNNNADSLQWVKKGQVQYTLMNLSTASYYLSRSEDLLLQIVGELDEPLAKASFGVSLNNPQLLDLLNNALYQIPPDEINALANRWRNHAVVQLSDWRDYQTIFLEGALLALAALVLFAGWNFSLRRQIRLRKQAQQSLADQLSKRQQLLDELAAAKTQAERANTAKSIFLAMISHEIKTPLSAVMGTLELELEKTNEKNDRSESLKTALRSASELSQLISDILDTVQIETGHLSAHPAPTALKKLCKQVIETFQAAAEQKNLVLQFQWTGPEQIDAVLDELRLRQVLSNLTSNAVKYTLTGQVTLHVTVNLNSDGNAALLFTVTDTGQGISAENLKNLFKPFEKIQSSDSYNTQGTGLGLYICNELARLMGGKLSIQSQPGEGTQASFSLSCPIADSSEPKSSNMSVPEAASGSTKPLSILVVDDHEPNRLLLVQQLSHLGHQTMHAQNGADALKLWRTQTFDLIMTDCSMPVMDGFELAKAIRKEEQSQSRAACMVLGVTAHEGLEIRQQCIQNGMNDCLNKPIGLQTLKSKLASITIKATPTEPPFDLATLWKLAGDNTEKMRELLHTLLNTNIEDLAKLNQTIADREYQEQIEIIHRIKGAARMTGAYRLLETIQTYESERAAEQRTAIAHEVSDSLEQLVEAMRQQIQAQKP